MPSIRPISDLRNSASEISDFCRRTREPVFITRNGAGDMVVLSIEEYERRMALIELYGKLAEAEAETASGGPSSELSSVLRAEGCLVFFVLSGGEVQVRRVLHEKPEYAALL